VLIVRLADLRDILRALIRLRRGST
jgi:hypothetical protein